MKKIIFFTALILLFSDQAIAVKATTKTSDEEIICSTSDSCRKACELGLIDKMENAQPEHQKLILQCTQDISKRFNFNKTNPRS
jgi:hypothetical protein